MHKLEDFKVIMVHFLRRNLQVVLCATMVAVVLGITSYLLWEAYSFHAFFVLTPVAGTTMPAGGGLAFSCQRGAFAEYYWPERCSDCGDFYAMRLSAVVCAQIKGSACKGGGNTQKKP